MHKIQADFMINGISIVIKSIKKGHLRRSAFMLLHSKIDEDIIKNLQAHSCNILLRLMSHDYNMYHKYMYVIADRIIAIKDELKYNEISNILYSYRRIEEDNNCGFTLKGIEIMLNTFKKKLTEVSDKFLSSDFTGNIKKNTAFQKSLIKSLTQTILFLNDQNLVDEGFVKMALDIINSKNPILYENADSQIIHSFIGYVVNCRINSIVGLEDLL